MKKAFTMIELIFVIVILGILAAVAMPKLAATRGDAKISKLSMDIETAVLEIGTFASAKGYTETNLSKMSNAISNLENADEADTSENNKAKLKVGQDADCVTVLVIDNGGEKNVTVDVNEATTDVDCKNIQAVIKDQDYSMRLSGQSVEY